MIFLPFCKRNKNEWQMVRMDHILPAPIDRIPSYTEVDILATPLNFDIVTGSPYTYI